MKHDPQAREPRSQVIFRHTQAAFRATALEPMQLAIRVADEYQARVAPHERIVEFHAGTTVDAITKAKKANLQIVDRFLKGAVKLPADLEEAWVASLPQPHREDCERELAQRYGFIGAKSPLSSAAAEMLCAGEVSIEFGQLLQRVALITDGQVNGPEDVAELQRALKEGKDLIAAATTLVAGIQARLEQPDCKVIAMREGRR
jgi:hypothetical protein